MTFILDPWSKAPILDRHVESRLSREEIHRLWRDDAACVIPVAPEGVLRLDCLSRPRDEMDDTDTVFLGLVADTPWFAHLIDAADAKGHRTATVRDGELGTIPREVASAATGIAAWIRMACYCEACGGQLDLDVGGFSKSCRDCHLQTFPRQDPAMIVAVRDHEDRLLLAHQPHWKPHYVSILAGFVESGESVEHSIYREVKEEANIEIRQVKYLGSQPWPLPRSLMLAFTALGEGDISIGDGELEWARWYSRDDVEAGIVDGSVVLPHVGSVASQVIAAWRRSELPAFD